MSEVFEVLTHLQMQHLLVPLLTSLIIAVHGSSGYSYGAPGYRYGFNKEDVHKWTTDHLNLSFHLIKASEYRENNPKWPKTDASYNSKGGWFGYAEYEGGRSRKDNTAFLYSECLLPSGPSCRLNYSAIVNTHEEITVFTSLLCDKCHQLEDTPNLWRVLKVPSNKTDNGWTNYSIIIGRHPVPFEINIAAVVEEPGSFVAIDNLAILDCEPEPADNVENVVCPIEHFPCVGTNGLPVCLTADRLCDQHTDCLCTEDEMEEICEMVPPEGRLTLQDCDFDTGDCWWYNVNSDDNSVDNKDSDSFRWRVANASVVPASFLEVKVHPRLRGAVAILRSVSFQPRFSGDGRCQARFWYRNTAKNSVLKLELVEVGRKSQPKPVRELWNSAEDGTAVGNSSGVQFDASDQDRWMRVVVDLNSVPINVSYILQFKAYSTNKSATGTINLLNVTLGLDCFHAALVLTSCNIRGAQGPGQADCDSAYHREGLVNVQDTGPLAGVQSWKVPETASYKVQAFGSRGGRGVFTTDFEKNARGARVTAKFRLKKGDELFFVVGQIGEDACMSPLRQPRKVHPSCRWSGLTELDLANIPGGGGGGGGGATIVFKKKDSGDFQVLLVAGGGGGLAQDKRRYSLDFMEMSTARQEQTTMANLFHIMTAEEAALLLAGTLEGLAACPDFTNQNRSWGARGGFGDGGGACDGGGFGGGADKSKVPANSNRTDNGQPGRCYVHESAHFRSTDIGVHMDSGLVELFSDIGCDCDYQCLWLDNTFDKLTCLCPGTTVVGKDGMSCVAEVYQKEEPNHTFLLVTVGALFVIFSSVVCACLYIQRHTLRARHPTSVKKMASFFCPCLHLSQRPLSLSAHVLPQIQRPPTVMHVNPNYDVVTTKCPEQGLKELPRKHLKLMSELGQGAFGEVYYGLLSNVPLVEGDLPVAVKTLPPVCTDQTEMDFLMEAVIVSKFNHPNIVKFIGVCFEQHPHYLVLELLEGGDLKSFLRQARPKWDQPSSLTVLDLLRLSLDVARGCQHLEEKHFIHRDIAARNCLLTTKGPNRTAKIADFGMARDIYRSDYYKKAGKAMLPVKWMPPEAFLDGIFTSKTDVWSFGILMWEVFSLGHMPYPGCSNEEVMNLVTQGGRLNPPESCPSAVFDIMVSCWSALPEGRPNFSVIISILERTLQDDDMVSRGLPVFYVPPIINTRGLKLQERSSPSLPHPRNHISRETTNSPDVALSPNTSGDGYLEPLLTHSSRSFSNDGQYRFSPDTSNSSEDSKGRKTSQKEQVTGNTKAEDVKAISKAASRTPRVFYKPGSSHVHSTNEAAASEALLGSHNSTKNSSWKEDGKISILTDENCDLRVDMDSIGGVKGSNDHSSDVDGDDEDLKLGAAAALPECRKKKKSYTHFPRPVT